MAAFFDFPDAFSVTETPVIRSIPARQRWDPEFLKVHAPAAIVSDDRPGAPADNIFWSANLNEAGHFIHGFESLWLPASALPEDRLSQALFAASRHWTVELHFQKGLSGGKAEAIAAARDTATNPAMLEAFALAIIAGEGPPAFTGLAGHEPDLAGVRRDAMAIARAIAALRAAVPESASYVAESSFFEPNWQQSYWGLNCARLLAVKQRYDPTELFLSATEWAAKDGAPMALHAQPSLIWRRQPGRQIDARPNQSHG